MKDSVKIFPRDRAHLAVWVWPLLTTASSNRNKFENSETKFSNDQLRTMDPHSHRRRHHRSDFADQRLTELARAPKKRFNINTTRLAKILATGLIILPILVILSLITRQHPSDHTVGLADARIVEAKVRLNITTWRLSQVTAGAPPTSEQTKTARAPPNVASKTRKQNFLLYSAFWTFFSLNIFILFILWACQ